MSEVTIVILIGWLFSDYRNSPVIQADARRDEKDCSEYEVIQQRKCGLRLHLIIHFGRLFTFVKYDFDMLGIYTVIKSIDSYRGRLQWNTKQVEQYYNE